MNRRQKILKMVAGLAATSLIGAILFGGVSHDTLLSWGRRLAALSAGLQSPDKGAILLSERQDRTPAGVGDETTTTPTQGSSAVTAGTTLPTDVGSIVWPQLAIPPLNDPPANEGNGGVVKEMLLTNKNSVNGVHFTNKSDRKDIDIAAALEHQSNISFEGNDQPLVLIMHTHTTECYMDYDAGFYNKGDLTRTTDNTKNMAAIGEIIADQLRAAGIGVIHDTTQHDYPSYNEAYSRGLKTVEAILEQYPSIQVVLDVHRDGVMADKTTKVKPTITVDGVKMAQMMILVGVSDTAKSPHPDWFENLSLGVKLQKQVYTQYGDLMRPLVIRNGRFNQHLSPGSILLEMGSDSNTLQESMRSAQIMGQQIALLLLDINQK